MFVLGVDGCRSGWIAVALTDGCFAGAARFDTFREALDASPGVAAVGVNIPIGLSREAERSCDRLVYEYIGPDAWADSPHSGPDLERKMLEVDAALRRLSPPSAPGQLGARTEEPAALRDKRQRARMVAGESRKSLLKFARVIDPEADARAAAEVSPGSEQLPAGRIVEVHSEASFRAIAGTPLDLGRDSPHGALMRTRLLDASGMRFPAELGQVGHLAVADLLDASAIAWSAQRYATGAAFSLPREADWQRDGHHVIAIWV